MEQASIYGDTEYRRVSLLLFLYLWLVLGLVWSEPALATYFPGTVAVVPWTAGLKLLVSAVLGLLFVAWLGWPWYSRETFLLPADVTDDRVRDTVAAKGKHLAGFYGALLGLLIVTVVLGEFPGLFGQGMFANAGKLILAVAFLLGGLIGSHYFVDSYAGRMR